MADPTSAGQRCTSGADTPPAQLTLADVTSSRLADLVAGSDPVLTESLRDLAMLLDRSSGVRLGWSSFLSKE